MLSREMGEKPRPLVVILGVSHRCGTNFLLDLLQCHPALEGPRITEDYIIAQSSFLFHFADAVSANWQPSWSIEPAEERKRLLEHIGAGIQSFFTSLVPPGRRVVLKTPSVKNLERVWTIFPTAQVLILVRDGRDVTESNLRSFRGSFERSVQRWKRNANTVLEYLRGTDEHSRRALLVRYEDLYSDLEAEIERILRFLGEEPERYDFDKARRLPVRGSSTYRGQASELHWEPVPKGPDFRPIGRWKDWSTFRRRRFVWVAGKQLAELNYLSEEYRDSLPNVLFDGINRLMDLVVWTAVSVEKVFRATVSWIPRR